MPADALDRLQERLGASLAANSPGSDTSHVLLILPSFSVSESILSHYGDRIPSLEHRYLNALLIPDRIPSCEAIYVSTRRPDPAVINGYFDLVPRERRAALRSRISLIEIDDGTPRSVAAKLLDRPDRLADLRRRIGGRPALIEPWNVTDNEVRLALALDVPINGTRPELRGLGFKSEGRRLLRAAGVPIPVGVEDVRTVDDVVDAVAEIRRHRPNAPGVVIKHDDSGAGDGNVVLDLRSGRDVRSQVEALEPWYLADLARGGIVEERIAGARFSSPSAQADILPDGSVRVLATHEQVLGGESGQVYLGCRFPADPSYAPELARHAAAIGHVLAERRALGRFSVDFVTVSDADDDRAPDGAGTDDGGPGPAVYALEINLRKGGTTHPYAAHRNLVPGRYVPDEGRWVAADGATRVYVATDNLVDPGWLGVPPSTVIDAVTDAGLRFDPKTRMGVVLHMLSGLAIDGRFGLTAIAEDADAAETLFARTTAVVSGLVALRPTAGA